MTQGCHHINSIMEKKLDVSQSQRRRAGNKNVRKNYGN